MRQHEAGERARRSARCWPARAPRTCPTSTTWPCSCARSAATRCARPPAHPAASAWTRSGLAIAARTEGALCWPTIMALIGLTPIGVWSACTICCEGGSLVHHTAARPRTAMNAQETVGCPYPQTTGRPRAAIRVGCPNPQTTAQPRAAGGPASAAPLTAQAHGGGSSCARAWRRMWPRARRAWPARSC